MLALREYMWAREGAALAFNRRAVAFEVLGLPESQRAWITTDNHRWQILRAINGIYGEWSGKYGSLDEALAALIPD